MNKQLLEAARAALDALSCTGEPDDPGHRCTHCDDYVDRNGPVRAVLRDALEAAQREQVSVACRPLTDDKAVPKETEPREQGRARLTADVVEQRLLTWRQRFVNRSGDQLALDDFMDRQSIDDLVDFVCDEGTPPGVLDALHERVHDDHDAMRIMRTVVDKGHNEKGNRPA